MCVCVGFSLYWITEQGSAAEGYTPLRPFRGTSTFSTEEHKKERALSSQRGRARGRGRHPKKLEGLVRLWIDSSTKTITEHVCVCVQTIGVKLWWMVAVATLPPGRTPGYLSADTVLANLVDTLVEGDCCTSMPSRDLDLPPLRLPGSESPSCQSRLYPGSHYLTGIATSPVPHGARLLLVSGRIPVLFDNKPRRNGVVLHFWGSPHGLLSTKTGILPETCSRRALCGTGDKTPVK